MAGRLPYLSIAGAASHADQRVMARRYLGDVGGDEYMAEVTASGEADEQIVIEVTPKAWLSADYSSLG